MESKKKDIVKMLLKKDINNQDEEDLLEMLIDKPIAIDVEKQEEKSLTFGEKTADRISEVAGSWTFILIFSLFLIFWIILNSVILVKGVDPYPFILLNLVLSCIAALQAPIIMMSQNRQAKKDSIRNQNDYCTDLKSELILEDLHDRMVILTKNQNEILKYIQEEREKNK